MKIKIDTTRVKSAGLMPIPLSWQGFAASQAKVSMDLPKGQGKVSIAVVIISLR